MPTILLYIPAHLRQVADAGLSASNPTFLSHAVDNSLPRLLQTPTGLALLEIQGKINISGVTSDDAALPIGKITFPDYDPNDLATGQSWMKTVHLYVGKHQRLTGEVKKLAKALGVLRKQNVEVRGNETSPKEQEHLEIMEIVEWKILFSSRPEPMGD